MRNLKIAVTLLIFALIAPAALAQAAGEEPQWLLIVYASIIAAVPLLVTAVKKTFATRKWMLPILGSLAAFLLQLVTAVGENITFAPWVSLFILGPLGLALREYLKHWLEEQPKANRKAGK